MRQNNDQNAASFLTSRYKGLGWRSAHPVAPQAGDWDSLVTPDLKSYRLPPPPTNNSDETRAELEELREMAHKRTADDIAQIYRWSVQEPTPMTHIVPILEEMSRKHRLSPPVSIRAYHLMTTSLYHAFVACWHWKYEYLRPRPSDLDGDLDVGVIAVPQHPSYPSGHSVTAGAFSAILNQLFPQEGDRFDLLAEECGVSRLKAGIHYRSDHHAGMDLGRRVAEDVLRAASRDGGPLQFHR